VVSYCSSTPFGGVVSRPDAQGTKNLSSAEDTTSSTVSPPAGSSSSAPEEFPVKPHEEGIDKQGSGASPPEGENHIELSSGVSPEAPPTEPGEDAANPPKTKPLPRVAAIAREVQVKATGARAGNVSGERELFTESTTTVLIFEKGAVICLMAAVVPGQLLFLTNEESKREVVTQVTRKRSYRPTECYVELEFTEPAPGFWGVEFSAATALLPKDAKEIAAAEMIASAETTDDELDEAAPPPSAEEVQGLKKEIDALRNQLKLLQTQTEPGQTESSTIPSAPSVSPADIPPQSEAPSPQAEKVPWAELTAHAFPAEHEPKPGGVAGANPELAKPALVFRKALPKRKRSFRARGQFTPGFRAGMLRLALLSSILGALIATAWYKRWLPWAQESKKISVSSWAGGVTTVSTSEAPLPSPGPVEPQTTRTNSASSAPVSVKETSSGVALSSGTPAEAPGNGSDIVSSLPGKAMEKPVGREKKRPPASVARPSPVHSVPTRVVDPAPTSASYTTLVPPKLLRSERAVASLDDLRDFETGSVVIDAIIDTAGNVNSMNVLSGPPSLRRPALEALKNYKYQPAMQNGKPVAAHVTVKIQFHFE
jgi:periplasmic protein TonB